MREHVESDNRVGYFVSVRRANILAGLVSDGVRMSYTARGKYSHTEWAAAAYFSGKTNKALKHLSTASGNDAHS